MSQFLKAISKPSCLIHKMGSRVFSSSVTGPFLRLSNRYRYDLDKDVQLFDACNEAHIFVPERTLPRHLLTSKLVGTTLGWGLYRDQCRNNFLRVADYLNPLASYSDSIFLPPVHALQYCQIEVLCNVAMSTHPLDYENWVVGIKFWGTQLSLCRPSHDLTRWTHISIPSRDFTNSNLMYSKRDKRFYLPAPGGNYLSSWGLNFKPDEDNTPKFHEYLYGKQPKLSESEYELLHSCSKAEHWVESPSGERFLVRCYSFVTPSEEKDPVIMVFREEETIQGGRYMCYTEDIGDVCIFLSGIDPFCLEASSCPGLKPNSIYLREPVFGVYHLSTRNIRRFEAPVEGPINPDEEFEDYFPTHWLPPLLSA